MGNLRASGGTRRTEEAASITPGAFQYRVLKDIAMAEGSVTSVQLCISLLNVAPKFHIQPSIFKDPAENRKYFR